MKAEPLQYSITDQDVLHRLHRAAVIAGIPPTGFKNWADRFLDREIRRAVGLQCDPTPNEAAMELGVHRNTIFNMIRRGVLKPYYLSARLCRIPRTQLEKFKRNTVGMDALTSIARRVA